MYENVSERKKEGYMCAKGDCANSDATYMEPVNKGYGSSDEDEIYKAMERNSYGDMEPGGYSGLLPTGIEKHINFHGSHNMRQMQPAQDSMAYMLAAMFIAQYLDNNKDMGEYSRMAGEMLLGSMLSKYMGGLEQKITKN